MAVSLMRVQFNWSKHNRKRRNTSLKKPFQKHVRTFYKLDEKNKELFMLNSSEMEFRSLEFGLFNYTVILLTAIVLIAVANEIVNICYILPVATCDLNLNPTNKGILAGAPYLGMVNNANY